MKLLFFIFVLFLIGCGQNPVDVSGIVPKNGLDGASGANALVQVINSAPTCLAGGITLISGTDSNFDGQLTSLDSNLQTSTICNGLQGQQGIQGERGLPGITPAFTAVYPITPCPQNTSAYREVLLCLYNGQVLASFSENMSGYATRLSFLTPGTFIDTDSSSCQFVVTIVNGSTFVSWPGGSYTCQKH